MSRVIHFDIPASDPDKSQSFYTEIFGWQFNSFPGFDGYWLTHTGEGPGINGGLMRRNSPDQPVTVSIAVPSIDDALEQIQARGGQVAVPKTVIPGGAFAFFKDPDGNIIGLSEQG